jgi:hypothetical protein
LDKLWEPHGPDPTRTADLSESNRLIPLLLRRVHFQKNFFTVHFDSHNPHRQPSPKGTTQPNQTGEKYDEKNRIPLDRLPRIRFQRFRGS